MRAYVLMGVMALSVGGWMAGARAQQSNSPLYQPSPATAPPSWPAWQGMQDGRGGLGPPYIVTPRHPTDSRNPALDNRSPTLSPVAPDLRDSTLRLGSPTENDALGTGVRRSEGLRSPAEPGRPSWR